MFFHGPPWLTDPKVTFQEVSVTAFRVNAESHDQKLDSEENYERTLWDAIKCSRLFSGGTEDEVIGSVLARQNRWTRSVHILAWCKQFYTNVRLMRVNNILAQGQERTRRTRGNRQNPAEPNYNQLCLGPNEVLAIEELLFRYAQ